jgi:hypothetical protein
MSFNRLIYDQCSYAKDLDQQSSILTYTLDPNKHYNCNPCRVGFGVLGGNVVSLDNTNLVDLESDLRGSTRVLSRCDSKKYLPQCVPNPYSRDGLPCSSSQLGSCTKRHLGECDLVHYRPKINNTGIELNYPTCPQKTNCRRPQPRLMTQPCQPTVRYSQAPVQQGYREFYTF